MQSPPSNPTELLSEAITKFPKPESDLERKVLQLIQAAHTKMSRNEHADVLRMLAESWDFSRFANEEDRRGRRVRVVGLVNDAVLALENHK